VRERRGLSSCRSKTLIDPVESGFDSRCSIVCDAVKRIRNIDGWLVGRLWDICIP
jgi:hypothetical protein